MLKKLSLVACLAGLISAPAFADDTIDVTFFGTVSAKVCTFSINGGVDQRVNLGSVPNNPNVNGNFQEVSFELTNCGATFTKAYLIGSTALPVTAHEVTPASTNQQGSGTIKVAFYSDNSPDSPTPWNPVHTDKNDAQVIETTQQGTNPAPLVKYVRLETGDSPTVGNVTAVMTYTVLYE